MKKTKEDKQLAAWVRFANGLKVSPAERLLILGMVNELRERVRKAEQAQWNAEHYLELCIRQARHEILMGRDHED